MSQLFDEKELMERIDGDWDFLADTVQMLESDGPGLMDEIRKGIAASDAAAVGHSAHTLKGMISNFCSPTVQASAFEVEKIGKGGDLSGAADAVKKLSSQLNELISELNRLVAARP
jgi:HPt (histidine-containing phosphotransfer) domain-containing protein